MESFKEQIKEDIENIQSQFIHYDSKLKSPDYAFNFWILQKMYCVEESLIPEYILEDSDRGIDCYYFNEDSKELFLIQNKYYNDSTRLDYSQIIDQFLVRSLEHLSQGVYKRSKELQEIFSKYKNDEEFHVYMHFYVTNNSTNYETIKQHFHSFSFNKIKGMITADFYDLNDIENKYYSERTKILQDFEVELYTIKKQTRIDISPQITNNPNLIRSQVMPVNVYDIYQLIKKAKKENYPLFEENIRDYIGASTAINANIIKTLEDKEERNNFIYYNNGITIIADKIETEEKDAENDPDRKIHTKKSIIKNPQIVNGCQTVNSIYEALNRYQGEDFEKQQEYKDVYVIVKLLQLNSEQDKDTYLKIVQYNNSQNAIKLKDFVAAEKIFTNLKNDLLTYGFFLMTKQSDLNKFRNWTKQEKESTLYKANMIANKIGLDLKVNDIKIDLTKFLQTILAYFADGYAAYVKKPDVLKKGSPTYKFLIDKLKALTHKDKLSIYLYYLKSEFDRKNSEEKINPVPYYLLTILKTIKGDNFARFDNPDDFCKSYLLAKKATNLYVKLVKKNHEEQYNKMIKQKMYNDLIEMSIELAKDD